MDTSIAVHVRGPDGYHFVPHRSAGPGMTDEELAKYLDRDDRPVTTARALMVSMGLMDDQNAPQDGQRRDRARTGVLHNKLEKMTFDPRHIMYVEEQARKNAALSEAVTELAGGVSPANVDFVGRRWNYGTAPRDDNDETDDTAQNTGGKPGDGATQVPAQNPEVVTDSEILAGAVWSNIHGDDDKAVKLVSLHSLIRTAIYRSVGRIALSTLKYGCVILNCEDAAISAVSGRPDPKFLEPSALQARGLALGATYAGHYSADLFLFVYNTETGVVVPDMHVVVTSAFGVEVTNVPQDVGQSSYHHRMSTGRSHSYIPRLRFDSQVLAAAVWVDWASQLRTQQNEAAKRSLTQPTVLQHKDYISSKDVLGTFGLTATGGEAETETDQEMRIQQTASTVIRAARAAAVAQHEYGSTLSQREAPEEEEQEALYGLYSRSNEEQLRRAPPISVSKAPVDATLTPIGGVKPVEITTLLQSANNLVRSIMGLPILGLSRHMHTETQGRHYSKRKFCEHLDVIEGVLFGVYANNAMHQAGSVDVDSTITLMRGDHPWGLPADSELSAQCIDRVLAGIELQYHYLRAATDLSTIVMARLGRRPYTTLPAPELLQVLMGHSTSGLKAALVGSGFPEYGDAVHDDDDDDDPPPKKNKKKTKKKKKNRKQRERKKKTSKKKKVPTATLR